MSCASASNRLGARKALPRSRSRTSQTASVSAPCLPSLRDRRASEAEAALIWARKARPSSPRAHHQISAGRSPCEPEMPRQPQPRQEGIGCRHGGYPKEILAGLPASQPVIRGHDWAGPSHRGAHKSPMDFDANSTARFPPRLATPASGQTIPSIKLDTSRQQGRLTGHKPRPSVASNSEILHASHMRPVGEHLGSNRRVRLEAGVPPFLNHRI